MINILGTGRGPESRLRDRYSMLAKSAHLKKSGKKGTAKPGAAAWRHCDPRRMDEPATGVVRDPSYWRDVIIKGRMGIVANL